MLSVFSKLSSHLNSLVDADPALAVKEARELDLDGPNRINLMSLRAATLVNAGASLGRQEAIDEGLELYRELHRLYPTADITYNLGNGLVEAAQIAEVMIPNGWIIRNRPAPTEPKPDDVIGRCCKT